MGKEHNRNGFVRQNFLKVIQCPIQNLESRVDEAFLEIFQDGHKIMNTKYHITDGGNVTVIIQYAIT